MTHYKYFLPDLGETSLNAVPLGASHILARGAAAFAAEHAHTRRRPPIPADRFPLQVTLLADDGEVGPFTVDIHHPPVFRVRDAVTP